MKTFWFQIIGLVTLICVAAFLVFNQVYLKALVSPFLKNSITSASSRPQVVTASKKLKIVSPEGNEKVQIDIEFADTKEKRNKGLGYRESLATTSGMLFLHDNSQKYTYWMKGMQFPIDIMWIKDDTIADIIPNVPIPVEGQTDDTLARYSSKVDVNKVLETNSGFVKENNIQVGDKILVQ